MRLKSRHPRCRYHLASETKCCLLQFDQPTGVGIGKMDFCLVRGVCAPLKDVSDSVANAHSTPSFGCSRWIVTMWRTAHSVSRLDSENIGRAQSIQHQISIHFHDRSAFGICHEPANQNRIVDLSTGPNFIVDRTHCQPCIKAWLDRKAPPCEQFGSGPIRKSVSWGTGSKIVVAKQFGQVIFGQRCIHILFPTRRASPAAK